MITWTTQWLTSPTTQRRISQVKGFMQTLPRRFINKYQQYHNQLLGSGSGTLAAVDVVDGPGTDIVSLDNGVIRVTPATIQKGTLFNEFVEHPQNSTVRTTNWYKANSDAKVSDRQIPVYNFSKFAGIENGHFKLDDLSNFNDTTTIIPVRNIRTGTYPITEILAALPENKSTKEDKEILKRLEERSKELHRMPKRSPWYSVTPHWGTNPLIVPATGKQLTEEELENAGKRIQLHGFIHDIFKTNSSQGATLNDSARHHAPWMNGDMTFGDFLAYKQRELSYASDAYSESIGKEADMSYWVRPMSEKEQKVLDLGYSKTNETDQIPVPYGDILGFNTKYAMIPRNIATTLNWYTGNTRNYQGVLDFLQAYDPEYRKALINRDIQGAQVARQIKQLRQSTSDHGPISVVTTSGDTIPISNYNASILDKKMVFGNPNGGMFIADFNNMSPEQLVKVVNPYLKNNPSYLFMPDMGAYSLYGLKNGQDPKMKKYTYMDITKNPTYSDYWNQFTENESKAPYDPAVHYLVGVQKNGGTMSYFNYFK